MDENEQGGSLRTVVVLSLIALIGIIFTTATISMAAKTKRTHQNGVSIVDNNIDTAKNGNMTTENVKAVKDSDSDASYVVTDSDAKTMKATGFKNGRAQKDIKLDPYIERDDKTYKVTSIGSCAFMNLSLDSVDIPNTVTKIESNAFAYNCLKSVTIPDSVTDLEDGVFFSNQLTKVNLSKNLTEISTELFSDNKLTRVDIPKNVTKIGDSAFQYNQLSEVVIPEKVTLIDANAFSYNSLNYVTFNHNLQKIGSSAFKHNNLFEVELPAQTHYVEKEIYHDKYSSFDPSVQIKR